MTDIKKEFKKKMVIGITGGTGCGKTVVMKLLEERFHAGLIIADLVGHELMAPGGANYNEIVAYFGQDILNESGEIDRPKLSKIVFQDKEKLEKLNSFSHPNIEKEIIARLEKMKEDDTIPFIAMEAALLIECGFQKYLDEMWYVYADEDTRISRLMEFRGYSVEKSRAVMKSQLNEEEYKANCDRIIDNSGSVEDTYQNLKAVFENDLKEIYVK